MVMNEYLCTHDQAKVLFIIILYSGGFNRWTENNKIEKPALPVLQEFKDEFSAICQQNIGEEQSYCRGSYKAEKGTGENGLQFGGVGMFAFLTGV